MSHNAKPFAVIRFMPTVTDDSEYFEVGLTTWLTRDPDDHMKCATLWPPESFPTSTLIKGQHDHEIQVMRFYDTYVQARMAVPKFMADSTYETEAEAEKIGRGKRIRKRPANFDSGSEEEQPIRLKRTKQAIPPPPPVTGIAPAATLKKTVSAGAPKVHKGQAETKESLKKKEREDVMRRLQRARAAVAARTQGSSCSTADSPSNTPAPSIAATEAAPVLPSSPQRSPWKVTPLKCQPNGQLSQVATPECLRSDLETPGSSASTPRGSVLSENDASPVSRRKPGNLLRMNSFYIERRERRDLFNSRGEDGGGEIETFGESSRQQSQSSVEAGENSRRQSQSSVEAGENSRRQSQSSVEAGENSRQQSQRSSKSDKNSRRTTNGAKEKGNLFAGKDKSVAERLDAIEMVITRQNVHASEMSSKMDIMMMSISRLQRALVPSEKRLKIPPNMPKLPLESEDQLQAFEKFLEESDVNLAAACDYMSNFVKMQVAEPEKKSALSILKRVLTNSLASNINLAGGKGKHSFRKLMLYKLFQGTLQTAFPKSDLSIAEQALGSWLKDASWRKQT